MHRPTAADVLRWLLAFAVVTNLAVSIPLWSPWRAYPHSPVFAWAAEPPIAGPFLFLALVASIVAYAVTAKRWAGVLFLLFACIGTIFDINRFQPWLFQYALFLGAMLASPSGFRESWRVVLGCAYLWSGIHKINPSFSSTIFPWLVAPFFTLDPGSPLTDALAAHVAVGEAAIGVALLWRRSAHYAAWAAVAMHAVVLLCLGPLGNASNVAVWPWNAFLIMACIAAIPSKHAEPMPSQGSRAYVAFLTVMIGILPALSLVGAWDSYPSFVLYSSNIDAATMARTNGTGSITIDLDRWAIDELGVPPYPEVRAFRWAVRDACRTDAGAVLSVWRRRTLLGGGNVESFDCGDVKHY